jgi:hypothetical protein
MLELVKINDPLETRLIQPGTKCLIVYPKDFFERTQIKESFDKEGYYRTIFGAFNSWRDPSYIRLDNSAGVPFVVDLQQTEPLLLLDWFEGYRSSHMRIWHNVIDHPACLDIYVFK